MTTPRARNHASENIDLALSRPESHGVYQCWCGRLVWDLETPDGRLLPANYNPNFALSPDWHSCDQEDHPPTPLPEPAKVVARPTAPASTKAPDAKPSVVNIPRHRPGAW